MSSAAVKVPDARGRPGPGRVWGRAGARPPARGAGARRGPRAAGGLPLWGTSRRDPAPLGNPVAWFRTSFLDDDDMSFADPHVDEISQVVAVVCGGCVFVRERWWWWRRRVFMCV